MKKALFLTLLVCSSSLFAQTLVLEEKAWQVKESKAFKGLDNYTHTFASLGFMAADQNTSFQVGGSYNFNFGFRYVNGLTSFYGMGVGFQYDFFSYRKGNEDEGVLSQSGLDITKESIQLDELSLEWINRIRLGKSGTRLGYFLDLGLYGARTVGATAMAEYTPNRYGGSGEISQKDLNFAYRWNYGLTARLGMHRYVIFVKYRLSESFKSNAPFSDELPELTFGFQLGLHN